MRPADLCRVAQCFPAQVARLSAGADPVLEPFAGGYRLRDGAGFPVDEREAELALRFPLGVLCGIGAARKWDLTDLTRDQAKDTVLVPLGAWHEAARMDAIEVRRTSNALLLGSGVLNS